MKEVNERFDQVLNLALGYGSGQNCLEHKIKEISKKNGDPKRFSCDIFIEGLKESSAFGKSHKQAETNAARVLIEKFISIGNI